VSGNFKKKTEEKCYLEVEEPRVVRRSKEKERLDSARKDKNPSNDNKLNRLFSKEKNQLREGGLKDSARVAEDAPLNQTANAHAQDESVSFSSVLATSVAVKSRRRKGSTEMKKEKPKAEPEDKHREKEEGDEAFIFYRPKKGKK
jgi:hypothetical protein